jgi:hypothetical protein
MAARLAGGGRPENPHGTGSQKVYTPGGWLPFPWYASHCRGGPECVM